MKVFGYLSMIFGLIMILCSCTANAQRRNSDVGKADVADDGRRKNLDHGKQSNDPIIVTSRQVASEINSEESSLSFVLSPESRCSCQSCDDVAWSTMASGFTCGERISFLIASTSETYACSVVAGKEFPDICGPQCDPARCSSTPLASLPVTTVSTRAASVVIGPVSAPRNLQPANAILPPPANQTPFNNPVVSSDTLNGNVEFGGNVIIFNPSMSTVFIQETFDGIYNQQGNNEMGKERYSLYFLPGTYGTMEQPLSLMVGYYMEVAGLGASPLDVVINGKIEVYNRCFEPDSYNTGKFIPSSAENGGLCFALINFWRTLSNLSINIVHKVGLDPCRQTAMFWAISQASSMRRVEIRGGDLSLMDYCTNPAFSSGGFISDSRHTGLKIINGSQQQFCARNLEITEWSGGVWNQVFLGVVGAPDDSTYPTPPFTTLETNPLSREKPYIFVDNGEYFVRVPSAKANSRITWSAGLTAGSTVPLSKFFTAKPSDTVDRINTALINGFHLIFTPGVYRVAKPIIVRRANTIVVGMGHATLLAVRGATPMILRDRPGILVSGLTFDAGSIQSPVLLKVGDLSKSTIQGTSALNPITLHDVYFRVGGPAIGKTKICLEINSNHVLVDHSWMWRADHGIENFNSTQGFAGDNVRWTTNIGRNGLVVNGNDVTITGLFVEHYQEYNVVWNGERGRVFFFQNELPYDPPTQGDWKANDGSLGWAGYKVTSNVTNHQLIGGGVYCYNRNNPNIITKTAFETPANVPGIKFARVYTRNLSGPGKIFSVLNGFGDSVDAMNKGPEYLVN